MSEVTITIVIKTAGDTVAVSAGDQAGVGGPPPQFIPGTATTDAAGAPIPSISSAGPGMEPAPPVPSLPVGGGSAGHAGPVPAPPDSLQQSGGAPTDVPPVPHDLSEAADEGSQRLRGGRRKSS